MKYWIVFSDNADWWPLRFLRKGFRHCHVVMQDNGGLWLAFDPMLNYLHLETFSYLQPDFDLPEWLRQRGFMVIEVVADHSRKRPAPLRPLTCVEAVKRLIGLHDRTIFTPWQLYKRLQKGL